MDIVKPKAVLIDWEGTISGHSQIFPYIEDILQLLAKHNIYTAVVSNMRGEALRRIIADCDMDKYFAKVIGYGDCSVGKPNTEPVYKALEGSFIEPSLEVFFIGDSQADIICATNSGCRSLFLNMDNYPEYMLRNSPSHHVFKSHEELWNFIDKCFK